uniref:Sulfhydryl oxidase n=1 Tax=Tanacetum cinerariifolium TaxID=118510 RepID=A0A6L2KFB5_TANCI|nr:sulfhydryl oxidase 2-like isoform X2 [Tanacetum cinerariifolium]
MFKLLFTTFLFIFFTFQSNFQTAIGSRTIKRDVDISNSVVDLNATNFDIVFKETPATFVIVEFYAHWCPACRNYKPQYERVARLFNGADAVHPGLVLMARVDCANKINIKLCTKFSIPYYPMLLWAPPYKFVAGRWNGKKENSEFTPIDDGRTAERLLKWINTQLGSSYRFEDAKFENDKLLQSNASDSEQIARAIYDVEEATNVAFDIILEHEMIKLDNRVTFIKFLQIMVAHNPSRRCRKGSAHILVNFDDMYPSNMLLLNKDEMADSTGLGALHTFQICGKQLPRGYWMFCHGSKNDTRGFSCGLWVLLHAISVRVDDRESQLAFTTTCDFIHKFFICEECKHFYDMCSSVSTPINTTRDFVLWLCQIKWDYSEVYTFLIGHYGNMLVSRYKDKDTKVASHADLKDNMGSEDLVASINNALVVPVGAAMAIAVASCLFGALAYVWRSQQKRKPRKSWT